MTTWRDNLEEKFSQTSKYDEVSECADALDAVADNEPEVPAVAGSLGVLFIPPAFKRLPSRADRLGTALDQLRAASEELADWAENHGDHNESSEATEAADAIENVVSELEGISFPGMY